MEVVSLRKGVVFGRRCVVVEPKLQRLSRSVLRLCNFIFYTLERRQCAGSSNNALCVADIVVDKPARNNFRTLSGSTHLLSILNTLDTTHLENTKHDDPLEDLSRSKMQCLDRWNKCATGRETGARLQSLHEYAATLWSQSMLYASSWSRNKTYCVQAKPF